VIPETQDHSGRTLTLRHLKGENRADRDKLRKKKKSQIRKRLCDSPHYNYSSQPRTCGLTVIRAICR
jgi:hypothetical protein